MGASRPSSGEAPFTPDTRSFGRNGIVGVGQDRFDIVERQPGIRGVEFVQIRVVGQVSKHKLHRNLSSFDYRFANHNLGVLNYAILK